MTITGLEEIDIGAQRWSELEDIIDQEIRKAKTPAKFMVALDKRTDITTIEKMLMVYALAFKHYQAITKVQIAASPMQLRIGLN